MDDGDLDFSSMGSYFDLDVLGDTAEHLARCTHTHTCNPPAHHHHPHTHTCLHVHSKFPAPASPDAGAETPAEFEDAHATSRTKRRRPSGNRAAVRKYREKKKEHTAVLQEEAAHLRALNDQLVRKVQDHAALEAEAARLRCLLVDVRGRIEGEIGAFPYQRRQAKGDGPGSAAAGAGAAGPVMMSSCGFVRTCEQPPVCFR
ncbi:basic leucine zipper 19-like [Hordeum vulgare subsp. vulgare]|uniref:BZIP domain-containing protein n=1 Tax=Hordeum vulgare subsp. vulgare TaxID=112509 RepID=A0A8I6Z131_HORVV|nr:basic leucine zipper 19-like [Hordeum vulgare subsp. vulgare]